MRAAGGAGGRDTRIHDNYWYRNRASPHLVDCRRHCEAGGFEKRFERGGICTITLDDIREGWYLMRVSDSVNIVDEIEVNGEVMTPKHPLIADEV